ncbi:hypothetical protein [Winogradskyella sp.]|uniref:hypothetical protein n=1 Tax=Winogradskyella sp. TaxID=1883156 RepID=UPI0026223D8D|nr:hypothetical protein [Winogradskyella sp.]
MKQTMYLAFSGLMMICAGLTLFFSDQLGVQTSKIVMPICMVLAGIGSFLFSKHKELPKVANQYHMAQGVGLIIYGVIVGSSVNSLESFLLTTTYFIVAYGLFELLFAFTVLSSKHKINKRILMSRLIAGAVNLIGGFILLMATMDNVMDGLLTASILVILGGISLLVFSRRI